MVSVINVELSSELYKCSVLKRNIASELILSDPPQFRVASTEARTFPQLVRYTKKKRRRLFCWKRVETHLRFPFFRKKKRYKRTSIVFLYGLTYFFGSTFSDWSKYCEEAKLARSSYYLVDVSESVHRNSDPRGIRFDLVDNQDHRQRKTQGWIFTLESQAGEGLINLLLSFSVSILTPFLTFFYPFSFLSGNLSLERELHNY